MGEPSEILAAALLTAQEDRDEAEAARDAAEAERDEQKRINEFDIHVANVEMREMMERAQAERDAAEAKAEKATNAAEMTEQYRLAVEGANAVIDSLAAQRDRLAAALREIAGDDWSYVEWARTTAAAALFVLDPETPDSV